MTWMLFAWILKISIIIPVLSIIFISKPAIFWRFFICEGEMSWFRIILLHLSNLALLTSSSAFSLLIKVAGCIALRLWMVVLIISIPNVLDRSFISSRSSSRALKGILSFLTPRIIPLLFTLLISSKKLIWYYHFN